MTAESSDNRVPISDVKHSRREKRPAWRHRFRVVLATTLPPLGAAAVEAFYLNTPRWSLLYPAVFISSWIGGLAAGVSSTILCAALMWWFFVPPRLTLGTTDPKNFVVIAVFIVMGIVLSVLQGRFRTRSLNERRIFRALIDNSSDFIGIADQQGHPTYINAAGRRLVGLAPDFRIQDTSMAQYYPSDVRGFVEAVILRRMMEHGLWHGETFFRNWQTEHPIPVDDTHFLINDPETGRSVGFGTITRDISDLKRAREAVDNVVRELRRVTSDLHDAQRLAHIGSWTWDRITDTLRWSEELWRIFGRDRAAEPPRMEVVPIYTPASTAALRAAIDKILIDGEPFELDVEAVLPDGSRRVLLARGHATRDATGHIILLSGTAQDVTQLRELERLRQEWVSVIAHDLRQPIGAIKSAAELLPELHEGDMPDAERKINARIRGAAVCRSGPSGTGHRKPVVERHQIRGFGARCLHSRGTSW